MADVFTARGGVIYDDAAIEAEERHATARRAAVIAEYGSEEAYDAWVLEETRRIRKSRSLAIARMRVARARGVRPQSVVIRSVRPLARRRGAGRPRTQAARSSAASGDSGSDSDSPPPPRLSLWRHPRWGAVTPDLLRILLDTERGER